MLYTQYLPGMRGIECQVANDGVVRWFVYDAHGNVIATVDSVGSDWGEVRNVRHFDVWGTQRGNTLRSSTHRRRGIVAIWVIQSTTSSAV